MTTEYQEEKYTNNSRVSCEIGSDSSSSCGALPAAVRRRVDALKKLHLEKNQIEQQFYNEFHKLKKKFEAEYEPIFRKRNQIVNGLYEPKDSDLASNHSEDNMKRESKVSAKGIPKFWLKVLKTSDLISNWIKEYDEPILKHLMDIKVVHSIDPMKISFHFHFTPNQYFNNEVLTKEFSFSSSPDSNCLIPVNCSASQIDWQKGKDVTNRLVGEDKQNRPSAVPKQSFFSFFSRAQAGKKSDQSKDSLDEDWNIGYELCNFVVPNAVLYYTGQVTQDSDQVDGEDCDEEEDDEDDLYVYQSSDELEDD